MIRNFTIILRFYKMAYKKFESSKILKSENPFPDTRASSINNGVFVREILNKYELDPDTNTAVEYGLLKKVNEHFHNTRSSDGKYKPTHLLILAEYGQGKTLSLRCIQDKIFSSSYDVLISRGVGNDSKTILNNSNSYTTDLLQKLNEALAELINKRFSQNRDVLDSINTCDDAQNLLLQYDDAFDKLNTRVFVFLDELDKLLDVNATDEIRQQQESFLGELKNIGDCCKKSISLWVSGTPNCLAIMDTIGRDYKERFDPPIRSTFNEEDTIKYINKKCIQKVQLISYVPFTNDVKREIFKYSKGKIRDVNLLCKELWNMAADKKIRIDLKNWKNYIKSKFQEPIKEIFGFETTDAQIELISRLVVNDKIGIISIFHKKSNKIKNELKKIIGNNGQLITKIERSYKLDKTIKDNIKKTVFGG